MNPYVIFGLVALLGAVALSILTEASDGAALVVGLAGLGLLGYGLTKKPDR